MILSFKKNCDFNRSAQWTDFVVFPFCEQQWQAGTNKFLQFLTGGAG